MHHLSAVELVGVFVNLNLIAEPCVVIMHREQASDLEPGRFVHWDLRRLGLDLLSCRHCRRCCRRLALAAAPAPHCADARFAEMHASSVRANGIEFARPRKLSSSELYAPCPNHALCARRNGSGSCDPVLRRG